jgi:hypothetical protein
VSQPRMRGVAIAILIILAVIGALFVADSLL